MLYCLLSATAARSENECELEGAGLWQSASAYTGTLSCDSGVVFGPDAHVVIHGDVTCPDGAEIVQGDGPVGITIEAEGQLILEAGCVIRAGPRGIEVEPGGSWESRGRHLRLDPTPAFDLPDAAAGTPLRVGHVRACPADEAGTLIESCEGSGLANELALCWPEASYPASDGSYDELVAAARPGDVLWFHDSGNGIDPPAAVNAPFEIVAVDSDPADRCLVLDLHQGCRSGSDCPHVPSAGPGYSPTERELGVAVIQAAQAPGARRVTVSAAAVATSGGRRARWLTCPDEAGVFPGWSAGIVDSLDAGSDELHLDPLGVRGALAAGTRCFVDYGFARGDPFTVLRPVVIGSSTSGTQSARQDTSFECRGTCDVHGTVFDELGDKGVLRGAVDFLGAEEMRGSWWWVRDAQSSGSDGGNAVGLARVASDVTELHHLALTGSEVEGNNLHGFEYGPGVSHVRFLDTLAWHSGDDHHVMNLRDPPGHVRLVRARFGFTGGGGGSCGGIDHNASNRPWTVIDSLGEDVRCAGSSGSASYRCGEAPCTLAHAVSIGADVNLLSASTGAQAASITADNIYSVADRAADLTAYLHDALVRGFTLRELSLGGWTDLARVTSAGLKRGIVSDLHHTNHTLLRVPSGAHIEDVVLVDPDSSHPGDSGALLLCTKPATAPRQIRRLSLVWSALPSTSFDRGIDGNDLCDDLTIDGLLVQNMRDDDDADPNAFALSFTAAQWAQVALGASGFCLSGNDAIADDPALEAALPAGSVLGTPTPFTQRFEPLPGSDADLAGCGARNVGARDMWALRVRDLSADPFVRPASRRAIISRDSPAPGVCGVAESSADQLCIGTTCSTNPGRLKRLSPVDPTPVYFTAPNDFEMAPAEVPALVWTARALREADDPTTIAEVRSLLLDWSTCQ
jgi:hypothetical protein